MWPSWRSAVPANTQAPGSTSEPPLKPGMVVHAGNLSTSRQRQEDQEFRVILSYIVSERPSWVTRDAVSKQKQSPSLSAILGPPHLAA